MITHTQRQVRLERLYAKVMATPPDLCDMTRWAAETDCGTVGCLAGHCMLGVRGYTVISTEHTRNMTLLRGGVPVAWDLAAMRYLRLTSAERYRLFYHLGWPRTYQTYYRRAKTPRGRKSVMLARLRHFIATGK